jgi:outer membrane protein
MKKSLLGLCVLSSIVATSAQADMLLGLYAGAQGWNMETTGSFADDANEPSSFNFEDETQGSFYVALEHPIPIIPNVKFQRTALDTAGEVTLDANFEFGGRLYTSNTDIFTDVELTSTDMILYYELFDNDLISFDVGINGKYLDGNLLVEEKDDSSSRSMEEFSGVVPMLYSRVQVGLPLTGFGAYAEGSFLSFDDHTLTDYQAAVTYSLLDNIAIDMTLQLGYRAFTLDLEDLDGIYTNLEFSGAFAGVEVHF